MPRTCTICSHEKRSEIETALISGVSNRRIATQFSTSEASIRRHASEHVAHSIKVSQAALEEAQSIDVVKQLKYVNDVAIAIMQESREKDKNGMALFAIDRIQKQLELQAKLLGDIDDRPQITLWQSNEWAAMRMVIIQALQPYPDARFAVASALLQLEGGHARLN